MAIILLIGEQYLKEKTPLSNNIDIELLKSNIEFAQDSSIQDILGTNLYNDIQVKYSAQTLSSIEIDLVNLIKPTLAYRSAEQSMPFINAQIRNKGINQLNSENATQADIGYMRYLREELRSRAEFLSQRVIKFLCNNSDSFPLYTTSNEDIEPSKKDGYTDFDLYFPTNTCGCSSSSSCNCG